MPTSRSSSSQNTRVFSPTVLLTQDTKSLFISLQSGQGYTLQSGLTFGDVIRYDPGEKLYLKSQGDTEENAEVVGVIETIVGDVHKVVISGSIAYPQHRLDLMKDENGVTADLDLLFLDTETPGGLTGFITAPAAGQDPIIVKPVIQLAPHSVYNGIVVNYIGYKVGNGAGQAANLVPVGNIIHALETASPGENYAKIDKGLILSTTDYPELYSLYGVDFGNHEVKLTLDSSSNITSTLVGKSAQAYDNGLKTIGTVTEINSATKTLTITRTSTSSTIPTNGTIYSNGYSWTLVGSSITKFTVPPVTSTVSQSGTSKLVPYIATKNIINVSIPERTTLESATILDNLEVGTITDIEQTILQLQADITTIKNILRIGGS
jgi:hypothetical protein